MSRILLLDLDHTLYSSTLPTGDAVDARIAQYLCNHLKLPLNEADALRQELSARYGTTLKRMELLHGVDRERYCDFIQDLEDHLMRPPNPQLREWLIAVGRRMPTYLFTNARRDWVDRCLASMGFADLLLENSEMDSFVVLQGILDIGFIHRSHCHNSRQCQRHVTRIAGMKAVSRAVDIAESQGYRHPRYCVVFNRIPEDNSQRISTVLLLAFTQFSGNGIQSFIPGDLLPSAVRLLHGMLQAGIVIDIVGN